MSVEPAQGRLPPAPAARGSQVEPSILPRTGHLQGFPCMQCHDKIVPRDGGTVAGAAHHIESSHFAGSAQCHICHDLEVMDRLRRVDGRVLSFDKAYQLCGQCHGEKLRDFTSGAHGKYVGRWSGARQRYNCTDCHDPHRPRPTRVQALPPPPFPRGGIRKEALP